MKKQATTGSFNYSFFVLSSYFKISPCIYPLIIQPPAAPQLMISGILEGVIPPIASTGI
jgi:hypothetical protein